MTKYTFLLPAYKAKFFDDALKSIQQQTYRNFKVLVSDDCSPDNIKQIYDKYADDPRFEYRRNEQNMGSKDLVSHWNLIVGLCDTEWMIMASDDDIYDAHFLEDIDNLQCKFPQVDLIRARVKAINENNELFAKDALYEECVSQVEFLFQKHYNNALRCIPCYVFRTKALRDIGGFVNFPLAWHSDDATVLLMAQNGVVNTSKMLLSFRTSRYNISGKKITHETAFQKALATILYNQFFKTLERNMKEKASSVYTRKLISESIYAHDCYCYSMRRYYFSQCHYFDMLKLCKIGNLNIVKETVRYFQSRIRQGFNRT